MEAKPMAVFIDTGIFVALHNADDHYHQRSKELIKNALTGNLGRIYTSDYIIDEAITTALVRTKKHDIAVDLGTYIIESPRIIKLVIDQDTFKAAWTKFKAYEDKGLSFTDCTSIALTEKHGIKQIMSFDCEFDGLTQRIC
ncbi:MAG: type II toxin-antitoxin system VapC family toxin [Candidatus Bathyarchaeia archaeon]|jgi:predicted nucleic acid-binding protein